MRDKLELYLKILNRAIRPAEGPIRPEQSCSYEIARNFYSEVSLGTVTESFALHAPFPRASRRLRAHLLSALPSRESFALFFFKRVGVFFHWSPSLLPSPLDQPAWDLGWLKRAGGWACCPLAVLAAGWSALSPHRLARTRWERRQAVGQLLWTDSFQTAFEWTTKFISIDQPQCSSAAGRCRRAAGSISLTRQQPSSEAFTVAS